MWKVSSKTFSKTSLSRIIPLLFSVMFKKLKWYSSFFYLIYHWNISHEFTLSLMFPSFTLVKDLNYWIKKKWCKFQKYSTLGHQNIIIRPSLGLIVFETFENDYETSDLSSIIYILNNNENNDQEVQKNIADLIDFLKLNI